jgi:hypothetical protein
MSKAESRLWVNIFGFIEFCDKLRQWVVASTCYPDVIKRIEVVKND